MPRRVRTDGKPPRSRRADKPKVEDRPGLAANVGNGPGSRGLHVELNEDVLYEIAKTYASFDTMAYIFGCSAMLISDKNKQWRPIVDKARAETQKNLLQAQFNTAINDRNPTMQIWLGKNYLEQKDVSRTEHTGPDGKPIQTDTTTRAVAYIPDNGRDPATDTTE